MIILTLFLKNYFLCSISPTLHFAFSVRRHYFKIVNIDAVSSLIKCEQLWVARNAIATVPSLKLLTELRFINLESNRIVNIDAIGLNDTHPVAVSEII